MDEEAFSDYVDTVCYAYRALYGKFPTTIGMPHSRLLSATMRYFPMVEGKSLFAAFVEQMQTPSSSPSVAIHTAHIEHLDLASTPDEVWVQNPDATDWMHSAQVLHLRKRYDI